MAVPKEAKTYCARYSERLPSWKFAAKAPTFDIRVFPSGQRRLAMINVAAISTSRAEPRRVKITVAPSTPVRGWAAGVEGANDPLRVIQRRTSIPEFLLHSPHPLIESIELSRRKLRGRNHVAASTVASHRLARTEGIRDRHEWNGRCAFVDAESARALASRIHRFSVEPEQPGTRKPDLAFAVDEWRARP